MLHKLLFFTYILLLLSCNQQEIKQPIPKPKPESFQAFFQQFNTDSVFQRSRTVLPLDYYSINWESEDAYSAELINTPIPAAEYHFVDLSWHDSLGSRQFDAYTQEFKQSGDTMKVIFMGVDNGIHEEYWFLLRKNQWWLIRCLDVST